MTPRRGGAVDQVDVELDLGPDAEEDELDRVPSSAAVRRRRWITIGVVGALAAVVAVVAVVDTWRTEARLAALRELPGVHAGLDEPLRQLWQADGHLLVQSGGAVVVLDLESGLARGLDARSGAELWSDEDPGDTRCLDSWSSDDQVLVCTTFGALGPGALGGSTAGSRSTEAGSVRLVSRDPATGEAIHEVTLDGDVVAMITVEEDVVVVVRMADGHLEALRWHPATGAEVWSYRSGDVVLHSDSISPVPVSTDPEQVVIGADRAVVLSLATGEETERAELGPVWELDDLVLAGGRQVRWSDEPSGDRPEGVVVDADGAELYTLPGLPVAPSIDDGSASDVLMVNGFDEANLLGVDVATGERLWEVDRTLWSVMRIGGRAVASGPAPETGTEMVTVLDARSGAVAWESESRGTGVTDGRVALLVDESGPRSSVVAHALADGYEEWRIPLPEGFWWTPPDVGEVVVFRNETGLVSFG